MALASLKSIFPSRLISLLSPGERAVEFLDSKIKLLSSASTSPSLSKSPSIVGKNCQRLKVGDSPTCACCADPPDPITSTEITL